MGNYRFKLSNMMPNSWFFKLKGMGSRSRNRGGKKKLQNPTSPVSTTKTHASKTNQSNHSYPRKSYYFSRELIPSDNRFYVSANSQRKSSRKRNIRTSSVSSGCNCRATHWAKADYPPEYSASFSSPPSSSSLTDSSSDRREFRSDCVLTTESLDNRVCCSSSCSCNVNSDVIDKLDELEKFSELELPPIITKPAKFKERITMKKGQKNTSPVRKHSVNSPGIRLRINSPRIARRRSQGHCRKTQLSDSFAVMKSSFDPRRDFRDSMVEMIMENNIRASKDLEDLLACYLSLNSDEYHDLIIQVFKQIWFDLGDVRLE